MKIRKNDEVQVIAGKDLGKKGKVHSVDSDEDKVVVAGVNMIKRHQKAGKVRTQAGIIQREAPDSPLQRHVGVQQVQQAHAGWFHCAGRRQQGAHLQEVRRGDGEVGAPK